MYPPTLQKGKTSLSAKCSAARRYRSRTPQATALYRLVETFYEEVKGCWEECFERLYGRWRGFLDRVVSSYVDCGNYSCGFARVRCPECASEYLVAFSCQTRSFCPSCAAKRAALFGAYLVEEVVAEVGHAQWVFTVPKMLRPQPTQDASRPQAFRLAGPSARAWVPTFSTIASFWAS